MSLKYEILTRFNHVHVKRHDKWRETMKIDFKTSNIVVQFVLKKMMVIWKRVDIVSCCVNCQCVIYVILCIKSSVSGECCIRYYTVVSLAIGKENAYPLQWRHNGLNGVSNHQPHHSFLSRLFGPRSKKTSKLRVPGLCAGKSPGTGEFPAQMASNAGNVSIWRCHHGLSKVLHESVAWNLLRYVILRVHPIKMWSHELHGISNHWQLDCLLNSHATRPSIHGIPSILAHMNMCYKSLKPKYNLKIGTMECRSNVFWLIAFWHFNTVNTLRPKQSGRHFADDIFKCIFLNENA